MFQRLAAYAIENDNTQLRFAIANAAKDVRYFVHMCESLGAATPVAQAVHQAYAMANNMRPWRAIRCRPWWTCWASGYEKGK
jgi:3-hydroxyisobutyrate dehydrogenase-like beta-hydroxyacid dehydrogenase